jgi:transcription initiation factor TFIIF subunit beta
VPTLHPFTRRPDGSITLHGAVTKTANLQMARTERYRNLCKNRLVESVTSDRYVKPVELADLTSAGKGAGGGGSSRVGASVTNTGAAGSSRGGFGDSVQQFGKSILDSQKAGTEVGRKRKFEAQPIRSVVFDLFSSQRYWTLKDMRSASGRLEKELREELSEMAEFHRSGEHKGTWELREEFRQGANASGGAGALDGS